MGKNIGSYPPDPIISGDEQVLGTNDGGETANYAIRDIAEFATTDGTGRMAIYDGQVAAAGYSESKTISETLPLRLEFGEDTEERFFPKTKYGTLFNNQVSAPAHSNFDFRFLQEGMFVEFDVEFDLVIKTSGDATISPVVDYMFDIFATYPSLKTEKQTITVRTGDIGLGGSITHHVKKKFSTYMKEDGVDNLLGGGIDLLSLDFSTDVYKVTNLIIRAII